MKDRRQIITGIMAAVGFLLLILDGQTAFQGALDGIELCIRTVIPSLFPFFIISMLLTSSLAGMNSNLLRPLGKILRIPSGSEGIFLIGLLSGYPTGAQSIATAHKNGQLSTRDAQRMMGFCSNAGPAFLFGMIGPIFSSPIIPWILWIIHIVSALLTGIILPGRSSDSVSVSHTQKFRIQTALERSVHTMAHVCGWIILFRVILAFLSRWVFFMLPNAVQIIISGGLELSNGCVLLKNIRDEGLRFLICSGFLGFGGLCVLMQTNSVAGTMGLGRYLPGKMIQTGISLILSFIVLNVRSANYLSGYTWLIIICISISLFWLIFRRINSRNSILNDV